jgi:hypothetical protein
MGDVLPRGTPDAGPGERADGRQEVQSPPLFGFYGEVLDQLELPEVRQELVRAIERKLYATRAVK